MELGAFEATVHQQDPYGTPIVTVGEQVFLYRRMQDAYDPALVAVINEKQQFLGYLDREVAQSIILPAIKEGTRFQCVVLSEPKEGEFTIQITPASQATVSEILARRGGIRRGGQPPLAGMFDEEEMELLDLDDEGEDDDALEEILGELEPEEEE